MSPDTFADIMSGLDNVLIVVTTAEGHERAGCLVGFHAQSSMDPGRYAVWLSKANYTYRVALRATHLGVHFLTSADQSLPDRGQHRQVRGVAGEPGRGRGARAGGHPALGGPPPDRAARRGRRPCLRDRPASGRPERRAV